MSTIRRHVLPHPKGWAVMSMRSDRASSVHPTQQEAIEAGRRIVRNLGGGELIIHSKKAKIRDSDAVPCGNDPFPPRDMR